MTPISKSKLSSLRIVFTIAYKFNIKHQTTTFKPVIHPKRIVAISTITLVGYYFELSFILQQQLLIVIENTTETITRQSSCIGDHHTTRRASENFIVPCRRSSVQYFYTYTLLSSDYNIIKILTNLWVPTDIFTYNNQHYVYNQILNS